MRIEVRCHLQSTIGALWFIHYLWQPSSCVLFLLLLNCSSWAGKRNIDIYPVTSSKKNVRFLGVFSSDGNYGQEQTETRSGFVWTGNRHNI
ncbi:hypothetical protein BRADI_3g59095v3 [Brachypodium distachyon]|uniref:Uncharacterized protein n=1 Tax=Brachypodium distachyon TaxID=15368 RepID=A0A2K2D5S7_BRADI|nr:hypothetical protein BRADI_3g59095v3 [Brachypodium distachyon]